MDSDPEGDIEVYELLADAVTGDDKESGSSRASSRRHLASNSDVGETFERLCRIYVWEGGEVWGVVGIIFHRINWDNEMSVIPLCVK